jgi:hypothetical protein
VRASFSGDKLIGSLDVDTLMKTTARRWLHEEANKAASAAA